MDRELLLEIGLEEIPASWLPALTAQLGQVLEAKLKGEGLGAAEIPEPDRSNVVDLMAALKRSLQQAPVGSAPPSAVAEEKPVSQPTPAAKESKKPKAAAQAATKSPRKRA